MERYFRAGSNTMLDFGKNTFGCICQGKNHLIPGGAIYGNLTHGQVYEIMMSSKRVCTHHHILRFLLISLIMKMHPNVGQTPGARRQNMARYSRIDICILHGVSVCKFIGEYLKFGGPEHQITNRPCFSVFLLWTYTNPTMIQN